MMTLPIARRNIQKTTHACSRMLPLGQMYGHMRRTFLMKLDQVDCRWTTLTSSFFSPSKDCNKCMSQESLTVQSVIHLQLKFTPDIYLQILIIWLFWKFSEKQEMIFSSSKHAVVFVICTTGTSKYL